MDADRQYYLVPDDREQSETQAENLQEREAKSKRPEQIQAESGTQLKGMKIIMENTDAEETKEELQELLLFRRYEAVVHVPAGLLLEGTSDKPAVERMVTGRKGLFVLLTNFPLAT